MYGTIAKMKTKPGLLEEIKKIEERKPRGFLRTIVYRMDKNPDELMLVVLFKDKESYIANANSPEQHEEYRVYRKLLQAEPEWYDGEVIYDTHPELEPMV
jgi:hypothetical protein